MDQKNIIFFENADNHTPRSIYIYITDFLDTNILIIIIIFMLIKFNLKKVIINNLLDIMMCMI